MDAETALVSTDRPVVIIDDPPRMNLLGLILGDIMQRSLESADNQRRFGRLGKGEVVVRAGEMVVTLCFEAARLVVRRGAAERPRAQVSGALDELMALSLGGGMVGPWLAGRLKTRGSLLLLLKLRPLLQA